jgi:hypothetical protein
MSEQEDKMTTFSEKVRMNLALKAEEPTECKPDALTSVATTHSVQATLHNAFTKMGTAKQTMAYSIVRSLYSTDASCIQITCGLHQNDMHDTLHFSATLNMGYPHTLHFNGFLFPTGFFKLCNITMMNAKTIEVIAEF